MTTEAQGAVPTGAENAYDRVRYPAVSHRETWPGWVAAVAALFGLEPPAVETARVLDVGCGEGGNLIPLALSLPSARCVGIDLAQKPIEAARARAQAVGVGNVEFRQTGLADAGPDLGQFDYIIAHGVYSWVPAEARDRLLAACKACLAPNGIAYVSHNVYPGWHLHQVTRGLGQFHVAHRKLTDPAQQAAELRGIVRFMAEAQMPPHFERAAYRAALRQELSEAASTPDEILYHDELGEVNEPSYFHEFAAEARRHGLAFLWDAEYAEGLNPHVPPQLREVVERIAAGDLVAREQYYDILKGRAFRRSLLVHEGAAIDYPAKPERVRRLYAGSDARVSLAENGGAGAAGGALDAARVEYAVRTAGAKVSFTRPPAVVATTDNPLLKGALLHLTRSWPAFVPFDELLAAARHYGGLTTESGGGGGGDSDDQHAQLLADMLLGSYGARLIELRAVPPRLVNQPSERPVASPLARAQAAERPDAPITNLLGVSAAHPPGSTSTRLLPLLDGTRDRAALLDALVAHAQSGDLTVADPVSGPVRDPDQLREILGGEVDRQLLELARNGLLIG